jgi:hypothetical protein
MTIALWAIGYFALVAWTLCFFRNVKDCDEQIVRFCAEWAAQHGSRTSRPPSRVA